MGASRRNRPRVVVENAGRRPRATPAVDGMEARRSRGSFVPTCSQARPAQPSQEGIRSVAAIVSSRQVWSHDFRFRKERYHAWHCSRLFLPIFYVWWTQGATGGSAALRSPGSPGALVWLLNIVEYSQGSAGWAGNAKIVHTENPRNTRSRAKRGRSRRSPRPRAPREGGALRVGQLVIHVRVHRRPPVPAAHRLPLGVGREARSATALLPPRRRLCGANMSASSAE